MAAVEAAAAVTNAAAANNAAAAPILPAGSDDEDEKTDEDDVPLDRVRARRSGRVRGQNAQNPTSHVELCESDSGASDFEDESTDVSSGQT